MNKTLLAMVSLFAAGTFCVQAEAGQYLHIRTTDGWRVLDLEQVDRLTFTGNAMVATDKSNNTVESFERSSVSDMYFDETSGVESIVADSQETTFTYKSGIATMHIDGQFEVYAVDGKLLTSIPAAKGETIDLRAINGDIVVLKSGKYTLKVALR